MRIVLEGMNAHPLDLQACDTRVLFLPSPPNASIPSVSATLLPPRLPFHRIHVHVLFWDVAVGQQRQGVGGR